MKPNSKTINLAKEYGFDTAKFLYSENGFDVSEPVNYTNNEDVPIIGMPIYIIQKGETSYIWQGLDDPLLLDKVVEDI